MKRLLSAVFFFISLSSFSQDFPYGSVPVQDISMTRYERDTGASAVVLKEFGRAFIRNGDNYELIFKYHVRIKILNTNGLEHSNIEIPLYHQSTTKFEKIIELKASSYNIENGTIREQVVENKNIFEEQPHKNVRIKKFAIPNVRVGSVIELEYTLESPFIFNFREWEFQSGIPKVESEYWASIPGVYLYNITLRGFLKLTKNENSIEKACLGNTTNALAGAFSADCALMKFGMKDIPAFVEEDYMTAKKNFLSSIQFELSEIRYPDGRIDKITKEWKDAEGELRQDQRFGTQLKRGKEIGDQVKKLTDGDSDEYNKAVKVYNFIRDWYTWNGTYGKYSEFGIKKAFDERKGNVGDINLSLVAALRYAGLSVDPVILSTRENGTVVELHPVLSEFNYVIASVRIGDKTYLADASDRYYPFGMLPVRCLNGKGRVMADRESSWIELKPVENGRTVSMLTLKLNSDGVLTGSISTVLMGYDAVAGRQEVYSFPSVEDYIKELQNDLGFQISRYELKNLDEREKPLERILQIEWQVFDDTDASNFLFNPFLVGKWSHNPFKASERLYPVDFGRPIEHTTILNLEYPKELEVINLPEKVGLSLPNGGGRFIVNASDTGEKLSLSSSMIIRRTTYTSTEYHYLKELFNNIIQVQNGELILRRKG